MLPGALRCFGSYVRIILATLVLASFGGTQPNQTTDVESEIYFPKDEITWEIASPVQLGWDLTTLSKAVSFAREHQSTALLILYRGRIIAEEYWEVDGLPTFTHLRNVPSSGMTNAHGRPIEDVGSVQKGVVGLLVGLAHYRGLVELDTPVSRYLGSGWSQTTPAQEAAVTLRHLMSMSSGLSRELAYEAAPDEKWFYNTPAYSRLFDVLSRGSALEPNEYTDAWLATPLGMPDTRWALRESGLNRYGLVTTARDLARMGLLMLAQGVWNGQRLISENVIGLASESSQPLNPAYGLLWWVNGKRSWDDWTNTGMRAGSFIPTAPNDLIAARGIGDRKIYVLPSRGLVVTRLGGFAMHDEAGEPQRRFFDQEFWRLLMGALPAVR